MGNKPLQFNNIKDNRGSLISMEAGRDIPFDIKRVYNIYGVNPNLSRGFHAHKDLRQVLICISGSCKVILDDGQVKSEYLLDKPEKGLFIDKMIWHEMHDFSENCILLVLASEYYDEEDYIRKHEDFLRYIEKEKMKKNKYFKHAKAIVESNAIGNNTTIWAFSHVLPDVVIGENCNLNDHTFIENNVLIGDNVTIKSGVHIWDGVTIEDNVFIGPSVVFTNDLNPRSKKYPKEFAKTIIKNHASIGANSTIVAGHTIGEYAMIGAGSVITKDIPSYSLWYGNPAKFRGYVCECGEKLNEKKYCIICNKDLSNIFEVNFKE